ncbi:MAG: DUF2203 domain-containing protein [Egibacteraceae bacterium]
MVRYWTPDEANAALPRVGAVVRRMRDAAAKARERVERIAEHAPTNGHLSPDESAEALQAAVRELAADGIVVRDAQAGLVDFPARSPSGRPYWLCWVLDEPAVEFWHWPEDGFAGRTPLTDPPA